MAGPVGEILLVGSGGFVGSILRYALGGAVHRLVPMAVFPFGTLAVNGLGCLLIGVLAGLSDSRNVIGPELRLFLLLGVLGGFTTFSAFGHETLALARDGQGLAASVNIALHLAAGLGCAWIGYAAGAG